MNQLECHSEFGPGDLVKYVGEATTYKNDKFFIETVLTSPEQLRRISDDNKQRATVRPYYNGTGFAEYNTESFKHWFPLLENLELIEKAPKDPELDLTSMGGCRTCSGICTCKPELFGTKTTVNGIPVEDEKKEIEPEIVAKMKYKAIAANAHKCLEVLKTYETIIQEHQYEQERLERELEKIKSAIASNQEYVNGFKSAIDSLELDTHFPLLFDKE